MKIVVILTMLGLNMMSVRDCNASTNDAEILYDQLEEQVSCLELKTNYFSKALTAADVLERAERIIRDYPESSISSNLISGQLRLGSSTLSDFRTSVFPQLTAKAGRGEDPLIDACMMIDPERDLGHYSPLQSVQLFLWRGERGAAMEILELAEQQIREFYMQRIEHVQHVNYRKNYEQFRATRSWMHDRDRLVELYKQTGNADRAYQIYEECFADFHRRWPYAYIYLDQKDKAERVLNSLYEENFFSELVADHYVVSGLLDYVKDYLEVGATNKAVELLDFAAERQIKTQEPYQEAASKYREHGTISQVAFLYCEMLATNEAISVLDAGMKQIPEIAAPDVKIYQLISIADAYYTANRSDKGLKALEDARGYLEIAKDFDATLAVAKKYAEFHGSEMTHQLVSPLYSDLMQRQIDPDWKVHRLVDLACTYMCADMKKEAVGILNDAYELSDEITSSNKVCIYLIQIAKVYIQADDLEMANEVLENALVTSQSITKPDDRALKLVGIAELHTSMGNLKKAEAILNDAYLIIKSELDQRKKRDILLKISKGLIEVTRGSQLEENIPSLNLRI